MVFGHETRRAARLGAAAQYMGIPPRELVIDCWPGDHEGVLIRRIGSGRQSLHAQHQRSGQS